MYSRSEFDPMNCGAKCGGLGPLTVRGSHVMPVSVLVGAGRPVCPCLVARLPWYRLVVAYNSAIWIVQNAALAE